MLEIDSNKVRISHKSRKFEDKSRENSNISRKKADTKEYIGFPGSRKLDPGKREFQNPKFTGNSRSGNSREFPDFGIPVSRD